MTEEQLNENLIKLELQGICQDCIYLDKIAPIIRKMLSEEYKTGLEQSRFDKNMLERENNELKKELSNSHQIKSQQKEFIEWLEQNIENEEYCYLAQNPGERCRKDVFEEALSKYKEIIGGKHE